MYGPGSVDEVIAMPDCIIVIVVVGWPSLISVVSSKGASAVMAGNKVCRTPAGKLRLSDAICSGRLIV